MGEKLCANCKNVIHEWKIRCVSCQEAYLTGVKDGKAVIKGKIRYLAEELWNYE